MSATTVFIIIAVFAALGLAGRLVGLFRQSERIEKKLDYSKMREWEDEEED
ncbi:MAG: hypothetical protein AB8G16_13705 [Gammaproteobacteria bacterium]